MVTSDFRSEVEIRPLEQFGHCGLCVFGHGADTTFHGTYF